MTHEQHADRKMLDLAAMRRRLAGKTGKTYWRSLSELAESEDFEQLVRQEFPRQAGLLDSLNRRDFLKVLGASLALAGLTACVPQETEKIVAYVKPPEELVPGKSIYFASAMVQDGYAKGVLIETTTGRPIKVEGNPQHPASLGASDIFMQASILELYDPDRAKQVLSGGAAATWADFTAAAAGWGQGNLRILSGPVTSPSLAAQIQAVLDANPQAAWYQHSPVGRANTLGGAELAFGQPFEPVYDFGAADVVLSLDCDFLFMEPGHIAYSRAFMERHQPISAQGVMNRLYVVESSATLTGSNADHRLGVKPSQVEPFARALAARLGVAGVQAPAGNVTGAEWLEPLAADLRRAGARALVCAGERQPPVVHAIAHAINAALGAAGSTVRMVGPNAAVPGADLRELVDELNAGGVDTLVILEGNPAYTAPADLDFAAAMQRAANRVYLGYYPDETAALATWFIPAAHDMEKWGDARAFDGTVSIIQPVIEPLFGGKSAYEVLAALQGQAGAAGYDLVRAFWQDQGGLDDRAWRRALSQGAGLTAPAVNAGGQLAGAPALTGTIPPGTAGAAAGDLEIVFEPDYSVWDGRFSNVAWLQELPKPMTKLTWDNAASFSPATAERLGLAQDAVVALTLDGRSVEAAVFVQPGQPDDVVTVSLGYGRTAGGKVQEAAGFNAYAIRTSQAPWFAAGLDVQQTGRTYPLVTTQHHWLMEDRELVREATLAEYEEHPDFAQHYKEGQPSLYPDWEYPSYAWGMTINLNTCIGCNACVVACQSENNIPTVGKDQVARGREMHWIRVDTYYEGGPDRPRVAYQPVPCMHCEKAPCEPVCPVAATSHSAEGINEMTYNRCVGTRYCSNNCPYKVRRFNFFKYVDDESLTLRALRNPDVTVRSRGVMEKCTFCVQRINEARINAEVEGRQITDGEVKTACQQACPTNAIVFGDINDQGSQVRQLKDTPLNYALLDELGTQPRTTYLAKVRNPNPAIPEGA
jgi:molybdopterin-containing oxidoreductase family iron-sulfur binding subunit